MRFRLLAVAVALLATGVLGGLAVSASGSGTIDTTAPESSTVTTSTRTPVSPAHLSVHVVAPVVNEDGIVVLRLACRSTRRCSDSFELPQLGERVHAFTIGAKQTKRFTLVAPRPLHARLRTWRTIEVILAQRVAFLTVLYTKRSYRLVQRAKTA